MSPMAGTVVPDVIKHILCYLQAPPNLIHKDRVSLYNELIVGETFKRFLEVLVQIML